MNKYKIVHTSKGPTWEPVGGCRDYECSYPECGCGATWDEVCTAIAQWYIDKSVEWLDKPEPVQ